MYKTVELGNSRYNFLEYGVRSADKLLFLHGYADSALMFSKLTKSLSNKYHVYALDFPMIHNSDSIYDVRSLSNFVKDFVNSQRINKFTLVGFSLGGLVGIHFAYHNRNRVLQLYLLNSAPRLLLSPLQRRFFSLVKPILIKRQICFIYSRINTNVLFRKLFHSPPLSKIVSTRMKNSYYSLFGTLFNILDTSLINKFNKLGIPKTVVLFKDDTLIPWDKYKELLENLNCEVIVFNRGWHASKDIYWRNIKSLWLSNYKVSFKNISIEN